MKTTPIWIKPAVTVIVVMGLAAAFLHHRGPRQHLGASGVKIQHDALLGGDNSMLRTNGVALPLRLTGFDSIALEVTLDELKYLPADTTFGRRGYRDLVDGFEAMLTVVLMGTDRSSIHRPEQCLASQGVSITSRRTVRVDTAAGPMEVLRCDGAAPFSNVKGSGRSRAVFTYMFLAADRQTSSHIRRHLLTMQDLVVRGEMPRWAGIQCFARCREGEEDATFAKMERLLSQAIPAMRPAPASTGGG
jgi:hypothetical protein